MIKELSGSVRTRAAAFGIAALALLPGLADAGKDPVFLNQGSQWTTADRLAYYTQDQGSKLIPLAWLNALKQADGKPFLADSLDRYGYLPSPSPAAPGLPIGFTVSGDVVGMNCSACHTRQIEAGGVSYRVDGGPGIVDFQSLAADLETAVGTVLHDDKAFGEFAQVVLGADASAEQQNRLRKEVEEWYLPYSTIMDNALPHDKPWGPVRADAVGMIFNRVTGLDIGNTPDHIIKSNITRADSPVRYPFVWNASIQDHIQWPGFADNGNDVLALARNLGEVFGVFAAFAPQKDAWRILGVDYLQQNSANFDGLLKLESLIKKIGPPKWPWKKGPWAVNQQLAAQGKRIFESPTKTEEGGCAACHGIRKGVVRSLSETWATPMCNVDTDTREIKLLDKKVSSGVLAGAQIPFLQAPLKADGEQAINVLGVAVIGSILQHESKLAIDLESAAKKELTSIEKLLGLEKEKKLNDTFARLRDMQEKLVTPENNVLKGAFQTLNADWQNAENKNSSCKTDFKAKEPAIAYESRVLEGIWAAAPYLHNGSVPTLADLLKPAAERTPAFKVGPVYDPATVGLAVNQQKFDYQYQTTDCSIKDSGNSRCGHEFGAKLSPQDKAALLEYLKTL